MRTCAVTNRVQSINCLADTIGVQWPVVDVSESEYMFSEMRGYNCFLRMEKMLGLMIITCVIHTVCPVESALLFNNL